VSSGLKSVVPGVQFQADYWSEKLLTKRPFLFQRWGVGVGHSEGLGELDIPGLGEALRQSSTFVDLMFRFSPGVRPVQSSFGVGARYFDLNILGGTRGDVDPTLYGLGLFWHTAPLGVVDATVNVIPFFDQPKWMEISAYYYPVANGEDFSLRFAYSVHVRGRLMFSKKWFLDANLNYHALGFSKSRFSGSGVVAEGSLGLGMNF